MEQTLEKMPPNPHFPGMEIYKHKDDGFVYCDFIGGPFFWDKTRNTFQARSSDVYVCAFPRSGTTWASELTWLIMNDLDYETARTVSQEKRVPYIEVKDVPQGAFDIPSPRCIRTHLPYCHLPKIISEKNCKIVYSVRNPKDMLVSFYNFGLKNKNVNYNGDFDSIFELFMQESLTFDPYWKHILQYWELRNQENVLIFTYEERVKNFPASIKKLASFLGKNLTDEQVQSLAHYCGFNSMRNNPSVNLHEIMEDFIRKGKIGEWKNHFSEDQNKRMDDYVKSHLSNSGLDFVYE